MYVNKHVPYGRHIDVYLNGMPLDFCIEADDEEGWALAENSDSGEMENLYGAVELKFVLDELVITEHEVRSKIRQYNATKALSDVPK